MHLGVKAESIYGKHIRYAKSGLISNMSAREVTYVECMAEKLDKVYAVIFIVGGDCIH